MLYGFGKVIMWTTLHFFFRKIIFTGRKHIPKDEAAILIANHSASFLDAMLLAVLMDRPMHFYARSDIFRKPWANKILRSFHMIPIYNVEHGKEDLHRNQETFSEGEAVLNGKGLLLVFPEGTSRVERIMLPLKKGTARVALQTESKRDFQLGLIVIPVGINYSAHRFRADILIHAGEPTSVDDYEKVYRDNPARAITQLTRELEAKFSQTILYVTQHERTDYINRLLELYRADAIHQLDYLRGVPVLQKEKEVCDQVSGMPDEEYLRRKADLDRYDDLLRRNRLMDHSVNGRYRFIAWHILLLVLGLPLFLLSLLLNTLPLLFAKWMADTKVTRIDFYTSVANAVGGFGYFLWWLILMCIAAGAGNTWVWITVVSAPLLLFIGIFWWEALVRMLCHARYLLMGQKHPVVRELHALRGRIAFWK
jgi:1-acyl-sn-glycerol-3-phosphate acyltransferase